MLWLHLPYRDHWTQWWHASPEISQTQFSFQHTRQSWHFHELCSMYVSYCIAGALQHHRYRDVHVHVVTSYTEPRLEFTDDVHRDIIRRYVKISVHRSWPATIAASKRCPRTSKTCMRCFGIRASDEETNLCENKKRDILFRPPTKLAFVNHKYAK